MNHLPLPKHWVRRQVWESKGTIFMGRKIENLSRDELIAVVHYQAKHAQEQFQENARRFDFLAGLRRG